MAISEISKQIVSQKRDQIRAQIEDLQRRKASLQDDITAINTELTNLRAQKDALTADIPEPVKLVE
jgi:predicted  nucleic acid-binding Zn-ribbon protein